MKQELLEMFAGECERLAEEKETEREWLSDFANMVLGEAAKVCDEHAADYSVVGTGMYDSMEHVARTCAAAIREMQAPNGGANPVGAASCADPATEGSEG